MSSFRDDTHADINDAVEAYYRTTLGEYLNAVGDNALAEATAACALPIEQAFLDHEPTGEPSVEFLLECLWVYLIDEAINPDESVCVKLVDLVLALQRRGVLAREPGGQECLLWGGRLWDELPLFGPQMREAWNFTHRDYPASYLDSIAFAARLTSAACGKNDAIDFTLYAMWDFRDSLEHNREQLDEMGLHHDPEDLLIGVVQWLKLCGPVLAALAAGHPEDDGADFSVPRWNRWRERLADIAEGPEPAAGTARNALSFMPALA